MPFDGSAAPVPTELRTKEFALRPIVAGDAEMDHAALMETRQHLRVWQQSSWPEDDFTVEANRHDLLDLEERHLARRAFTYTVLDPAGTRCLGCVYLFPTSATFLSRSTSTPVADDHWDDVDAVVYFWVRRAEMETGMDGRLLAALRAWFTQVWKLTRTVYVTHEQFTRQVEVIERTGMTRKFELVEPGKPGRYQVRSVVRHHSRVPHQLGRQLVVSLPRRARPAGHRPTGDGHQPGSGELRGLAPRPREATIDESALSSRRLIAGGGVQRGEQRL